MDWKFNLHSNAQFSTFNKHTTDGSETEWFEEEGKNGKVSIN